MASKVRLNWAAQRARSVLATVPIRSPADIDVECLAFRNKAVIQFKPLQREEGHLLRSRRHGLIIVDTRARESSKWRFVAAHELGHYLLHVGQDQLTMCTDADLHNWYATSGMEPEANAFAAELLMPADMFSPRLTDRSPDLGLVFELSHAFRTSRQATALRVVGLSRAPCCVVLTERGRVKWAASNDRFGLWIPKGMAVKRNTYAGELLAGGEVEDAPRPVMATAWSDSDGNEDLEIVEHSRKSHSSPHVLSMLWRTDTGQPADDDHDEDEVDEPRWR